MEMEEKVALEVMVMRAEEVHPHVAAIYLEPVGAETEPVTEGGLQEKAVKVEIQDVAEMAPM